MATLKECFEEFNPEEYQRIINNIKNNPVGFIEDVLEIELFDYQKEMLKTMIETKGECKYIMSSNVTENKTKNYSQKEIMAIKAANRIKDKWAENNFFIVDSTPKVTSWGTITYYMLIERKKYITVKETVQIQEIINIVYDEDTRMYPFDVSAYVIREDEKEFAFHWDDNLLNLLNEQMNCIDDAVCILQHSEEMLNDE